jgi:hypothetical protein
LDGGRVRGIRIPEQVDDQIAVRVEVEAPKAGHEAGEFDEIPIQRDVGWSGRHVRRRLLGRTPAQQAGHSDEQGE